MAGEEPSRRAALEVAEETGIVIGSPQYIGRYAGTVASHDIFLAQAGGEPRPNRRELQDACWWDGDSSIQVQQHVNAILTMVRNWIEVNTSNPTEAIKTDLDLPALQDSIKQLPEP